MFIKVKFVKVREGAKVPERGSKYAAGYDLSADLSAFTPCFPSIAIHPGETVKIPSGLAVKIPDGYFGGVYARSGLSTKEGLRPATCVSVIDCDYIGEILIPIHNDSEHMQFIKHGQRIAQLVIQPYLNVEFEEVDKLENTERGNNGFGSTGI